MGKQDYEGEYVKAPPSHTIWLVQDGKRVRLTSQGDWRECGLRPLHKISREEVEAIPYSHDWGEEPPEAETEGEAGSEAG